MIIQQEGGKIKTGDLTTTLYFFSVAARLASQSPKEKSKIIAFSGI
jgi:hypothetical protein